MAVRVGRVPHGRAAIVLRVDAAEGIGTALLVLVALVVQAPDTFQSLAEAEGTVQKPPVLQVSDSATGYQSSKAKLSCMKVQLRDDDAAGAEVEAGAVVVFGGCVVVLCAVVHATAKHAVANGPKEEELFPDPDSDADPDADPDPDPLLISLSVVRKRIGSGPDGDAGALSARRIHRQQRRGAVEKREVPEACQDDSVGVRPGFNASMVRFRRVQKDARVPTGVAHDHRRVGGSWKAARCCAHG